MAIVRKAWNTLSRLPGLKRFRKKQVTAKVAAAGGANHAQIKRSANPVRNIVSTPNALTAEERKAQECIRAQLANGHTPDGMTQDEAFLFIEQR